MRRLTILLIFFVGFLVTGCNIPGEAHRAKELSPDPRLAKIGHIIVISLENHSFDNLFGMFPGAAGLKEAGKAAVQTDKNGKPYATLPIVMDDRQKPGRVRPVVDKRFPADLPNRPFPIAAYIKDNEETGDLTHRFYQQQLQINGGKMDRFADVSKAGGLVMGYYDGSNTGLWHYAKEYTLADHFFHSAFGGSFLNHMWLVCACTPVFPDAPESMRIKLDGKGNVLKDAAVTPDGYAVNTVISSYKPQPAKLRGSALPPQDMPTIGDRLSEKSIGWAWYAGGWDDAMAGKPAPSFQFHHQPFTYFRQFADGTKAKAAHLKDEKDFLRALTEGTLPQVAFYKPLGEYTLHPDYANMASSDAHVTRILQAILQSPVWKDSVVIVTFDENGGYWDHVAPPVVDRFGPGMRVPTLIISPFARRGFIDHTTYDTTAILALIERRFGLKPLGDRDKKAADISASFLLD